MESELQEKFVCVQFILNEDEFKKQQQFFQDIAQSQNIKSHKFIQNLTHDDLQKQQFIFKQQNAQNDKKTNNKLSQDFDDLDLEFQESEAVTQNKLDKQQYLENKVENDKKMEEEEEKQGQCNSETEEILIDNEEDDDTFLIHDFHQEFHENDKDETNNKKNKKEDFELIIKKEQQEELEKEKIYSTLKYQKKIQKLKKGCFTWFQSSKYGSVIEGTNIIPGKTPLLKPFWKKIFDSEDERLYFGKMIEELKEKGTPIKLIIDLTEENKYYTFWKLKKQQRFGLTEILKDIDYQHFPLSINNPPRKQNMNKLYNEINKHQTKKDFYIFMHCFCGINRTGYVASYFLCRNKNLKSQESIKRFENARGIKFDRKNLVQDLQEKFDY